MSHVHNLNTVITPAGVSALIALFLIFRYATSFIRHISTPKGREHLLVIGGGGTVVVMTVFACYYWGRTAIDFMSDYLLIIVGLGCVVGIATLFCLANEYGIIEQNRS